MDMFTKVGAAFPQLFGTVVEEVNAGQKRGHSTFVDSDDRLVLAVTVTETCGTRIPTHFFWRPRVAGWIPARESEQSIVFIIPLQTGCLVRGKSKGSGLCSFRFARFQGNKGQALTLARDRPARRRIFR
jgi:hypothetical protein